MQIRCFHCQSLFDPNPRIKNQKYCSKRECQRARRRDWQRQKLATDPDYKANQRHCQNEWHKQHPGYYRRYRERRPESARRNRLLQKYRDTKRRRPRLLAKMDACKSAPVKEPGAYYLIPRLAKMDASIQEVVVIPTC
jgi:hypothetical protein